MFVGMVEEVHGWLLIMWFVLGSFVGYERGCLFIAVVFLCLPYKNGAESGFSRINENKFWMMVVIRSIGCDIGEESGLCWGIREEIMERSPR